MNVVVSYGQLEHARMDDRLYNNHFALFRINNDMRFVDEASPGGGYDPTDLWKFSDQLNGSL